MPEDNQLTQLKIAWEELQNCKSNLNEIEIRTIRSLAEINVFISRKPQWIQGVFAWLYRDRMFHLHQRLDDVKRKRKAVQVQENATRQLLKYLDDRNNKMSELRTNQQNKGATNAGISY